MKVRTQSGWRFLFVFSISVRSRGSNRIFSAEVLSETLPGMLRHRGEPDNSPRVIPNRVSGEGSHQSCWITQYTVVAKVPLARSFACAQDDKARWQEVAPDILGGSDL